MVMLGRLRMDCSLCWIAWRKPVTKVIATRWAWGAITTVDFDCLIAATFIAVVKRVPP